MSAPRDTRAAQRERTRLALAAAALRLALEQGPDAITVSQIAGAAGVSYRTFFNYFLNKEDAIIGPLLTSAPSPANLFRGPLALRPPDEPPLQAALAVMREGIPVEELRAWSERARLAAAHPALHPRYLVACGRLEADVAAAVAEREGYPPDDLRPALIAAFVASTARIVLERCDPSRPDFERSMRAQLEEAQRSLLATLLPG